MKSFNTFNNEFTGCLEGWIREMNRDGSTLKIEKREVTKNNDQLMHALILTAEDIIAAPTIYVEDFYMKYQNGERIKDLEREAIMAFAYGVMNQPKFMDFDMDSRNIRDYVILKVLEIDRNKKWLEDNMYKDMGNGLCTVPYVMMEDGNNGVYGHPVTKDIAQSEGIDEDELFELAMENTVRRLPPLLVEACEPALNESKYNKTLNPYNEEFEFQAGGDMYLLTSQSGFSGAVAIFYPGMMEIIATLLEQDYYVIPSSVNEVLIVPVKRGPDLEQIERMTRQINAECVDTKEILSDRIFRFDRKRGELVCPPRMSYS